MMLSRGLVMLQTSTMLCWKALTSHTASEAWELLSYRGRACSAGLSPRLRRDVDLQRCVWMFHRAAQQAKASIEWVCLRCADTTSTLNSNVLDLVDNVSNSNTIKGSAGVVGYIIL